MIRPHIDLYLHWLHFVEKHPPLQSVIVPVGMNALPGFFDSIWPSIVFFMVEMAEIFV